MTNEARKFKLTYRFPTTF